METREDAIAYDAMDHSQPNTAFVARLAELNAQGHMLDIGTGPGHIPLMVAEKLPYHSITAIDLSDEMLKLANHKLSASNHTNISFQIANASQLPFKDHQFDTVFSNTILHHIHQPLPFLTEAWRVLKPGGTLLIRDLFRPPNLTTLEQIVAQHAADCDPHQRKLFSDSLHAAFTKEELETLATQAGMQNVHVVIDTDRHLSLQSIPN